MGENEKQLYEHPVETQDKAPEVSDDMKKEQEQATITQQTEISAADLQKQIKEKLVLSESKEDKDKLLQMGNEVETNKDDQSFLTKTSQELKNITVAKTEEKSAEKPKNWREKSKQDVWNRFKKTSLATGLFSFLNKVGLGDRVKELQGEEKKEVIVKGSKDPEDAKVEETNVPLQDSPVVDTEIIDEATPPDEEVQPEEIQPEITKGALKQEIKSSFDAFTATAKSIDSNFSMFTKNGESIVTDGQKLDAAYQTVITNLQKIPQLFANDPEMQEFSKTIMYQLSQYYTDRSLDNDHHTDPIKAVQLLTPSINKIQDKTGLAIELPAMPTQDDLLQSLQGSKLASTIAEKLSSGLTMDQILADDDIHKGWNEQYKKLFDKWEGKFDGSLKKIYERYKAGKYPNLTPMQKKSLELLKDIQGVSDRRDWKDTNADMAKNIAGTVAAVAAGIAVTVATGGAGAPVLGVILGGTITTVGMRAVDNKRIGGKDLGVNFALNTIPFGVGRAFSVFRKGTLIAKSASKALLVGTYAVEGAVDVGVMSAGHSIKTGESFVNSIEDNLAWALFPLVLHSAGPALKGIKNTALVKNILARKNLADETLSEVQRAKILAQLGQRKLSQQILDKLNTKLKTLKGKETFSVLEEHAALQGKKETIVADVKIYIEENVVLSSKAAVKPVRSGMIDTFNEVGDKLVIETSAGVRKQITLLRVKGKDSMIMIEGQSRPVKVDLSGGRLRLNDPGVKGEKIKNAFVAKHPKNGKDINVMMKELDETKVNIRELTAVSKNLENFGPEMNELSVIYPQLQRDLKNLRKGESIDDFLGVKAKRTDKGYEFIDKTGKTTTVKTSGELLSNVLPTAAVNGEKLLTYKLAHLYRNNLTPEKIQAILQRSPLSRTLGGKNKNAYEIELGTQKYQVHFDKSVPEGVVFKDATGQAIAADNIIARQLESKVFAKMSEKYKNFAYQCKDVKTPLGRLIPDAMKPKMLTALSQKLHKPISVIENMSVGPVIEACEAFATAPTFGKFFNIITGGSTFNRLALGTIIYLDLQPGSEANIGVDYVKYVLGGQLMALTDIAEMYIDKKVDEHKAENAQGETFSST